MRTLVLPTALLAFLLPSLAVAKAIPCSDLPMAESFVQKLRPGPNTRAAERHLEVAKAATSDAQCSAELRQVDRYARRSVAGDKRRGHGNRASARAPRT
ncbi:MAG TPA: hypothetical protein VJN67_09840 [Stellaceae bacterium]|nr:hypothetical protein [Stellaceae bacterium]